MRIYNENISYRLQKELGLSESATYAEILDILWFNFNIFIGLNLVSEDGCKGGRWIYSVSIADSDFNIDSNFKNKGNTITLSDNQGYVGGEESLENAIRKAFEFLNRGQQLWLSIESGIHLIEARERKPRTNNDE